MNTLEPFDIAADLDTPVSAYLKLADMNPRFLLESVERGEKLARYSFIGFGDSLEIHMDASGFFIDNKLVSKPKNQGQYLKALRQALTITPQLEPKIDGLPFSGGLVGVSGYDVVRLFEDIPARNKAQKDIPIAAFTAPTSILVFDHLTRRVALLHNGSDSERSALRSKVIEKLHGPIPDRIRSMHTSQPLAGMSESEFIERVCACQKWITSGDVYQIVLSILFEGKSDVPPFEVYRALRLLNPSPYMFFLEFGELKIIGSSPEALVKLQGEIATLRPIAGTLPRGLTSEEDERNANSLLTDDKELAEHVMLVDLARNDLGRVAKPGTIKVEPYKSIERYSHVMHIVSGVSGQISRDKDAFDLFAASFPAGTLVGAPKVRAMEIIEDIEETSRGLYAGTAGYFDINGDMDQAITIRTIVFNGKNYSYQAGAGIVADSDPKKEYAEVLAKSEILKRALEMAGEGI